MIFTRVFAAALALLPIVQILAAPATVPPPMKRSVNIADHTEAGALLQPMSLDAIVASVRGDIETVKLQLGESFQALLC
jgi:hypothetical protein